jgi:hypothetical protein
VRSIIKIASLCLFVLTDARYAKAEVITLSCDGTMIDQRSSERKPSQLARLEWW